MPTPTNLSKNFAFGNINSLAQALNYLIGPAFIIAGVAVTIYFIIGAFKILISGGDKEGLSGGKQMIVHSIIGFILLMLLFLIFQFIPEFLGLGGFKII